QLWYGNPADVLAADTEISIVDSAKQMEGAGAKVEVLAQALARVATKVEQIGHADRLVQILGHLSRQSKLSTVKHICQQGITAALRMRYLKTDVWQRNQIRQTLMQHAFEDPANGALALLLAYAHLESAAQR